MADDLRPAPDVQPSDDQSRTILGSNRLKVSMAFGLIVAGILLAIAWVYL
jgi:hypothetical protein